MVFDNMHEHSSQCYFLSLSLDCKNAGTFLYEISKHQDKPYKCFVYDKFTSQFFLSSLSVSLFIFLNRN